MHRTHGSRVARQIRVRGGLTLPMKRAGRHPNTLKPRIIFARLAVIVAVHLGIGAMLDKELRLGA
jgi:hypothetical protein